MMIRSLKDCESDKILPKIITVGWAGQGEKTNKSSLDITGIKEGSSNIVKV